ncbi:MAG: outer membrane lipoprotein-sorting protein [Candidatus Bipolaricaulota bacterium]|nr:MAG: outer membrane lipoprotein-sorting protein [Candidatus Bipolaricaulota bacterium]
MNRIGRMAGLIVALTAALSIAGIAQDTLTADEILTRVEMQGQQESGSFATIMKTDTEHPDGITTSVTSAVFIRSELDVATHMLLYILEPARDHGLTVLIWAVEGEDSRIWLFLPAIGDAKELDAEGQDESFAGTTFSYGDFGGGDLADDFTAELLREETVTVGEEEREAYVLAVTARPDADVDQPTGTLWIDKEEFLILRGEYFNESGNLESTFAATMLGTFEDDLVADAFVQEEVLTGKRSTTTFSSRLRLDDLPDEVFDPAGLPTFDPADWGL